MLSIVAPFLLQISDSTAVNAVMLDVYHAASFKCIFNNVKATLGRIQVTKSLQENCASAAVRLITCLCCVYICN